MLEKNKIYLMDCMEGLKMLDDNSVDLFLFSPPYNKKGYLGKKGSHNAKEGLWNEVIKYDNYDDDMPEDEYEKWQIELINLCLQKLKPTGSIFYQHKMRPKSGSVSIPYTWICKTNCIFRQLIIWNRKGTTCIDKSRFLPTTEQIYWLTKSEKVRFERQGALTEVWDILADTKNSHPAPYPLKLAENVIKSVLGSPKMIAEMGKLLVVDCFMGSGTTAVAAKKLGCDYIGFDLSQKYIDMANERIALTENKSEKLTTIWD